MDEGVVIKAYSGFYYVQVGEKLWECSLRGRFRKDKQNVLVGDRVQVIPRDNKAAVVEQVLPRMTELVRPSIANVDQAVIVFALQDPKPNLVLLDRLLVVVESKNIQPVICFNKIDLDDQSHIDEIKKMYNFAGYRVIFSSALMDQGVEDLKEELKDKISVFAGPSGVGKSTLLNRIQPGLALKTGQVSEKIGRGRHTTRHTELLNLSFGGLVADSPGFSNLYLPEIEKQDLAEYFPEFLPFIGECKFTQCLHFKEPGCKIKEAVEQGKIHHLRYENYLIFLDEIGEKVRRY